jgi:hypothetical protein
VDLLDGDVELVGLAGQQADRRAGVCERDGGPLADAAQRAGHQGDQAGQ